MHEAEAPPKKKPWCVKVAAVSSSPLPLLLARESRPPSGEPREHRGTGGMRKKRWDEKALLSASPTQEKICPSQPGGDPGTQRAAGESGELFEGAEQGPPSSWPCCREESAWHVSGGDVSSPGLSGKTGPRVRSSAAGFSLSQINISALGVYSSSSLSCEHLGARSLCLPHQPAFTSRHSSSLLSHGASPYFGWPKRGTKTHGGQRQRLLQAAAGSPGRSTQRLQTCSRSDRGNPSDASRSSSSP